MWTIRHSNWKLDIDGINEDKTEILRDFIKITDENFFVNISFVY